MPDGPRPAELRVAIWRGTGDGAYRTYRVPRLDAQTVLDAVSYVQRHADSTLAYRFACRVGMCGSCAMTVNGVPRWTCRTRVERVARWGRLRLAPLRNLPVIRDLVVDMTLFFENWRKADGQFAPTDPQAQKFTALPPDAPQRRAADAGLECIGCGVCHAACDVVAWRPGYLGPAALNRAWTLVNDVRDGARSRRLAAVAGDAGCHACHSHQSCTRHCPTGLNPAAAIAALKRVTVLAAIGRGP